MVSAPNEWLSTYISQLGCGRNMIQANKAFHQFSLNNITINLYVLGMLMEDTVFSNVYGCKIITLDWNRVNGSNSKLMQQSTKPRQLSRESPKASIFSFS